MGDDGRHGAVGACGRRVVYASPTIEYAAHHLYTKEHEAGVANFGESTKRKRDATGPGADALTIADTDALTIADTDNILASLCEADCHAQFVFELRVRPGSYEMQQNTLCGSLWPDHPDDAKL